MLQALESCCHGSDTSRLGFEIRRQDIDLDLSGIWVAIDTGISNVYIYISNYIYIYIIALYNCIVIFIPIDDYYRYI